MEKKRIGFIDLAKGLCISLVVLHHCHIETPYLVYIRMPLYFILSGLFFKTYDGFIDFTKRKINKILIPFVFFYTISFIIYLGITKFAPGIRINSEVEEFFFLDPWYSRLCFNNPLWFLLSLFWCNLIYYLFHMISKNIYLQGFLAVCIAVCSYFIKGENSIPLYFNKSLYFFPFFYLGSLLRKTDLLYEKEGTTFYERYKDLILGGAFLFLFFLLPNIPITSKPLSVINRYVCSSFGVLAVLLLLKRIKKIPVISYYGRYSIVILCTSYLVYSPLRVILPKLIHVSALNVDYIVFLVTMFLEYFIIKFCIAYLPYVTAQKDVIKVSK